MTKQNTRNIIIGILAIIVILGVTTDFSIFSILCSSSEPTSLEGFEADMPTWANVVSITKPILAPIGGVDITNSSIVSVINPTGYYYVQEFNNSQGTCSDALSGVLDDGGFYNKTTNDKLVAYGLYGSDYFSLFCTDSGNNMIIIEEKSTNNQSALENNYFDNYYTCAEETSGDCVFTVGEFCVEVWMLIATFILIMLLLLFRK